MQQIDTFPVIHSQSSKDKIIRIFVGMKLYLFYSNALIAILYKFQPKWRNKMVKFR